MIRTFWGSFVAAVLLTTAAARGGNVTFNFQTATTAAESVRTLELFPIGAPYTNGAGVIVTRSWAKGATDTNGTVIISNVYGGDYRSELAGIRAVTTNWYRFPVTNGALNASDWVTAPTNNPGGARAWTTTESDGRYARIGSTSSNSIANLNGLGTNTTFYGPVTFAGVATNGLEYVTNETAIIITDTNHLVITLAGTAGANGTYTLKTPPFSAFMNIWTNNSGGSFGLVQDINTHYGLFSDEFAITNGGGSEYYFSSLLTSGWGKGAAGANPVPTVSLGPVTNAISSMVVAQVRAPMARVNTNLYVDPYIGDDLFAVRGRPDRPYQTLDGVLAAITTNETIYLAPGTYKPSGSLIWPAGTRLIGAGKRVTNIRTGTGSTDLSMLFKSRSYISGISSDYVFKVGILSQAVQTNVVFNDVEAYGISDGLLLDAWGDVQCWNCDFGSTADCVADIQSVAGNTNGPCDLFNCNLHGVGTAAGGTHGILSGSGIIRMFGGSIRARDGVAGDTICVNSRVGAPAGGSVELSGVNFEYSTTNGTAYAIADGNSGLGTVTVRGMLVPYAGVKGSTIGLQGGLITTGSLILTNTAFTNYNSHYVQSNSVNLSQVVIGTNAGIVLTNGTAASQGTWLTNGAGFFQGSLTANSFFGSGANLTSLTGSRVVLSDVSKNLVSAAASGAVPIDADGTAATAAQVNALFPGNVLTNGETQVTTFSNAVNVDATHILTASNEISAFHFGANIGAVPTVVTNAGLNGTCTVVMDANSKDSRGSITVTTGTATQSSQPLFTVTFSATYTRAPFVLITPMNVATALIAARIYVNSTTGGFTFSTGGAALVSGGTAYQWSYWVIE